jgi:hypothetical protein
MPLLIVVRTRKEHEFRGTDEPTPIGKQIGNRRHGSPRLYRLPERRPAHE